ncbi:DUF2779 domain-containing protein [Candidatus Saccharibacteria bacterium]|nr:DUF2779 domain-containing protein [Candidatus Saccharibacteria bacterium]
MTISKSDYMAFLKHPAYLWVKKNAKELIPPVDAATQAMFDTGNDFEQYAEARFDNITRLGFNNYKEYLSLPARTEEAIKSGAKMISQARFEKDGFTCISDLIEFVGDREVDLIEIKSSTEVKDEHLYDLAFQTVVLESCGYKVRNISVIYVNNQYVRDGEIDTFGLTIQEDVTERVMAEIDPTKVRMKKAMETAMLGEMPDPSVRHCQLGSYKEWLGVYRNIKQIPDYSIYDLERVKIESLGQLEDLGVELLADIPDDFRLSNKQRLQVVATRAEESIIDKEQTKGFLDGLKFPLYFFDYETLASAVPALGGIRPYQQVPCQYSLHVLRTPDGELEHIEYLHQEKSNPSRPLAERLIKDLGDSGDIIVWNQAFEMSRNRELGEMMPEHAEAMQAINNRVVDLMIPFSRGWYVDKRFKGSASIKKVLPVIVPELSYAVLDINNGGDAQKMWMEAILEGKHDREKVVHDLLKYCELDTLAMVEIHKKLREVVDAN